MIRCPGCGMPAFLTEHRISLTGVVEPEFRCPRSGCAFGDQLQLDGWKPSCPANDSNEA